MSCQKIKEWLENSPAAGLNEMPPELGRHLHGCRNCSLLLSRLRAQYLVRLPANLTASIPDIKKHVLLQAARQNACSEKKTWTFAWPLMWKMAFLTSFIIISLAAAYFMTDRTNRMNSQKNLSGKMVATIMRTDNLIEKLPAGTEAYVRAMTADRLFDGDAIQTGDNSSAELIFADNSKVLLGPGAWFKVDGNRCIGELRLGRAVFEIVKQTASHTVKVLTPQGVTTVLGTKFVQEIGKPGCFIAVSQGIVEFRTKNQERQLLRSGNLLRFDNSGKIIDRKEPGSAAILKLYDLKRCIPVEVAISPEKTGSENTIHVPVATSTKKIDKSGINNTPPSGSVQTMPTIGLPGISRDDNPPENILPVEPDQYGESGQSTLGISGF